MYYCQRAHVVGYGTLVVLEFRNIVWARGNQTETVFVLLVFGDALSWITL